MRQIVPATALIGGIALLLASEAGAEMNFINQQDQPKPKQFNARVTPTRPQILEHEVLVKYQAAIIPPTASLEQKRDLFKKLGAKTAKELGSEFFTVYERSEVIRIKLPPRESSIELAIQRLQQDPNVLQVRRNYKVYGHAHHTNPPNDQAWLSHKLWGLDKIHMGQTWDLAAGGIRGGDIIIAVLDTGIDYDHPDLKPNMSFGNGATIIDPNYNECDLKPQPPTPKDFDGHGTHVSGIVAARGHNNIDGDPATSLIGVNWEAKLMAVKMMCNVFPTGTLVDAVEAIHYAVDNKATVIVGSWGFPAEGLPAEELDSLRDAIERAGAKNILYVASAGNNYTDLDTIEMYPQHFLLDNIIVVTATDPTDRLWFEKPLTEMSVGSNWGRKVHIAAPGEDILSTWPSSYTAAASGTGTSMAAPHVAGCAALLQAKRKTTHPTSPLSPAAIKYILLTSVDLKDDLLNWVVSGGVLNCHYALQKLKARSSDQDSATDPVPPRSNSR